MGDAPRRLTPRSARPILNEVRCLLTLTVLLACASTAQGRSPEAILAWHMPRALKAWPSSPCAGRERAELAPRIVVNGRSVDGIAFPDECRVIIKRDLTWYRMCLVLVHELGHLARYSDPANVSDPRHSLDPTNVMYVAGPANAGIRIPECWEEPLSPGEASTIAGSAMDSRRAVRCRRRSAYVYRCVGRMRGRPAVAGLARLDPADGWNPHFKRDRPLLVPRVDAGANVDA